MASDIGIIPGGGKVVLPLLALGGIALWINYYYRRRPTVSSQEEIFEVDDTKEDYLSQLPDDALSSILGNLTVRDAVRTSILSTRWKDLFASTQQPTFECFYRDSSQLLKFSLELLSQSSSLKHLSLSSCVVLSSPKVRFNSLMTLALSGVVLTTRHLEGILSSCSNLKKLNIEYSKLPYKLRLAGTVTIVVILECDRGKEIDLHTIECKIKNNRNYFPIENPTEMKMFRNLRKLSLIRVTSYTISEIFKLSRLLGDFPLLQYLSFVVIKIPRLEEIRGSRRPHSSPTCHTELKQVTYDGFYGSEAEMEFILYILRGAIVLEQMFLSPGFKNYFCSAGQQPNLNLSFDERKRNSIQQKLHGQAISKESCGDHPISYCTNTILELCLLEITFCVHSTLPKSHIYDHSCSILELCVVISSR